MNEQIEPSVVLESTPKSVYGKYPNLAILLALFASIISFICIFEVAFFYSQTLKKLDQQALQFHQSSSNFKDIELIMFQLKRDLQQEKNATLDLQRHLAQLTEQQNRLMGNNLAGVMNLKLSQIQHLLEQAQLSLQFNGSLTGGLTLLQVSNQRIAELNRPELLEVQKQLARDILAIQALPALDQTNLLSRLNALSERIVGLPMVLTQYKYAPMPIITPTTAEHSSAWKAELKQTLQQFKGLIIIRHRTEPFEPLLPPDQETAIQQTLTQLINQAAWAVLHQNQATYHWSLMMANQLINRYYPAGSSDVLAIHQEILSLGGIQIQPAIPNLEPLLQQFIRAEDKIKLSST